MTSKEKLMKDLEQIPDTESVWNEIEALLSGRKPARRMLNGRPLVPVEEISPENWPYPPEPEWDDVWKELNQ